MGLHTSGFVESLSSFFFILHNNNVSFYTHIKLLNIFSNSCWKEFAVYSHEKRNKFSYHLWHGRNQSFPSNPAIFEPARAGSLYRDRQLQTTFSAAYNPANHRCSLSRAVRYIGLVAVNAPRISLLKALARLTRATRSEAALLLQGEYNVYIHVSLVYKYMT